MHILDVLGYIAKQREPKVIGTGLLRPSGRSLRPSLSHEKLMQLIGFLSFGHDPCLRIMVVFYQE
jgi:hypothetical protein